MFDLKLAWEKAKTFYSNHSFSISVGAVLILFTSIAMYLLLTATPAAETSVVDQAKVDPMVLPKLEEPQKVEEKSKKPVTLVKKSTKYKVEEKVIKVEEPDPLELLPEYREAVLQFEKASKPEGTK